EVLGPSISRQDACFPLLPKLLLSLTNYRESGLVLRRDAVAAVHSSGGPLTDLTPAAHPLGRGPLKMPLTCRSQCPYGSAQLGGKRSPDGATILDAELRIGEFKWNDMAADRLWSQITIRLG